MRARSISPSMRLPGKSKHRTQPAWRAIVAAARKQATSTDHARIQSRLDAVKTENELRYLRAGGRRWS